MANEKLYLNSLDRQDKVAKGLVDNDLSNDMPSSAIHAKTPFEFLDSNGGNHIPYIGGIRTKGVHRKL